MEAYQAALSLYPHGSLYVKLLIIDCRWGRSDQAVEAYQAALSLDPVMTSARNNLKSLQQKK